MHSRTVLLLALLAIVAGGGLLFHRKQQTPAPTPALPAAPAASPVKAQDQPRHARIADDAAILAPFVPRLGRMTIRTEGGEIVVQDAIFYGTYVLLQPLPAGDHTISFGGELAATNAHRAVTYQIHVE